LPRRAKRPRRPEPDAGALARSRAEAYLYKRVLLAIARGHPDPQGLARGALDSGPPTGREVVTP